MKKRSLKKFSFTLLVGIAVVSFWRGIWVLMDEYLFPQNIFLSGIISIIVGILVFIITERELGDLI